MANSNPILITTEKTVIQVVTVHDQEEDLDQVETIAIGAAEAEDVTTEAIATGMKIAMTNQARMATDHERSDHAFRLGMNGSVRLWKPT